MNKMQQLAAVALAALALTGVGHSVEAAGKPKGYGKDACVTLYYDLKHDGKQHSMRDYDFGLNLFGCQQDVPGKTKIKYSTGACAVAANKAADRLVQQGRKAKSITPGDIGRRIGGEGRVVKGHDCTLYEDQSWG